MSITTRKELKAYIIIDQIMNGEEQTIKNKLKRLLYPNLILSFLKYYRKTEYYLYRGVYIP